jgi:hypothetical protein
MRNLDDKGPSINAPYQVAVHLSKQCKRRIFIGIDQSKTIIAMFVNGSKLNEQSL